MKIVIKPELKISQLQEPMFGCINAKKKEKKKKEKKEKEKIIIIIIIHITRYNPF